MSATTAAGRLNATAPITRARYGLGCSARLRAPITEFMPTHLRRWNICAPSLRTCARAASDKSVKSWMPMPHSNLAAALRRPGVWPKSCEPGAKSMNAKIDGKRNQPSSTPRAPAAPPELDRMNIERRRLAECTARSPAWKKWGPYLSERQWGTVREDYSPHGNAWDYFPHDHARSRAYRWGEDGIAGISDDSQRLCLSLAMWNSRDPILKERLFGLTNSEGNHGEDVKELYYYLDATPTHSYLKMLYKYPQREFPYARLVEENRRRGKDEPEFELLDTGIFDDDRYFDVFIEYAKAGPDDILMLVTVHNRGPETAAIHLLPQLWFRNTWSWKANQSKPTLRARGGDTILAEHPDLRRYELLLDNSMSHMRHESVQAQGLLFTDNETNVRRHYGQNDAPGCFKDAFHEYVIAGNKAAVNPQQTGTKAAAFYKLTIPI